MSVDMTVIGGPTKFPVNADRTRYGSHNNQTKSFQRHHTQRIVRSAVAYDAKCARVRVGVQKRKAILHCGAAAPVG